jgi:hypothetical protein
VDGGSQKRAKNGSEMIEKRERRGERLTKGSAAKLAPSLGATDMAEENGAVLP